MPRSLLVIISVLDPARRKESLDPVEKFTDWELFQSLASELASPNIQIQIHFSNEADKEARDFAVTVVSAYRLSARKTTILDRKYEIHVLDALSNYIKKLRKLWQVTTGPACKTVVNCVTRNVRRMVRSEYLKDEKQR
jgi:hypothetical protein